jgi:hypothetical protein
MMSMAIVLPSTLAIHPSRGIEEATERRLNQCFNCRPNLTPCVLAARDADPLRGSARSRTGSIGLQVGKVEGNIEHAKAQLRALQ